MSPRLKIIGLRFILYAAHYTDLAHLSWTA
ncbi:hypothetical protein MTR67_010331 [Solanum verrucosum]|uniref:Uncharacterized protein n=1 Tax=Solanum verrucosum TaxID=315347 RepID=A0AAF0QAK7_SOLVR|nr:hypothetical protein MTR67_010331 [Solanum verrucosum]